MATSYGERQGLERHVRLLYDPETELEGKHILLVEDIIDTGKTLQRLMALLAERKPRQPRDLRPAGQAAGGGAAAGDSGSSASRRRRRSWSDTDSTTPRTSGISRSSRTWNKWQIDSPRRPPRTNWGNLSKNLALWLLVGLLALALFQMMSRQRNPTQEFSYTEFSRQLDQGNVARVEVFDGKRLEGDFRTPVTQDGRTAKSFTVLLPVANSEAFIKRLEDAGVPILAKEPKGGITAIIIAALPWIVILGLWFFLFRQMQAGGSRAFSFGKSKAKLLAGDTPKVTFADVAGADEAKVELQEIIEFLKDPQKFTRLGGRLPKGALLVGPPGTGKTLLAKAVAGEAGRPFFSMSGSDFVEMFVGVGASRVRDLFEQGKAHAPCIIFIDEIDAVGRHRGAGLGGGHDEREQTLNQLLVEMDGFESNDGVILIAATNRPDVLDPALLRPGRFDRQIVVDAPDLRGREGILRVHTRKMPLAADVRLEVLARGTPGMAGADLANLVNEAARARRAAEQDAGGHGGLRGRQGQGDARRRAAKPGADRGGAPAHRVPRGGPRRRGAQGPGQRSAAQGDHRAARPRARPHRLAARGRPPQLHQGLARSAASRWPSAAAWPRRSSSAPTR